MLATAYSLDGWPESDGITATGTQARYGEIAVDPEVIPLGTRMYIVSEDGQVVYGIATAEDTGSLIQLFFWLCSGGLASRGFIFGF